MTDKHYKLQCPSCNSDHIARVQFGMPDFSKKQQEDEASGKIILAGCTISKGGDPHYYCNACEHQWRRDGKKVEYPVMTKKDWLKLDEMIQ